MDDQEALEEFKGTIIPWFLIDVGSAFRALKGYVRHMESQVPVIAEQERERLEETPLDEEEVGNVWFEHHWLFDEAIPRTLRYSFVVAVVTTLEFLITRACKELKKRRSLSLSLRDLAGKGIPRALLYLQKIAGVKAPALTPQLSHLLTIRNCIAHANGLIDGARAPAKVLEAIAAMPGFSKDGEGYISIEAGVCEELVEAARIWFDDVLRAAGFFDKEFNQKK